MEKVRFGVFQDNLENVKRARGTLELSMFGTGRQPRKWTALCVAIVALKCIGLNPKRRLQLLICYADELKEGFCPFMDQDDYFVEAGSVNTATSLPGFNAASAVVKKVSSFQSSSSLNNTKVVKKLTSLIVDADIVVRMVHKTLLRKFGMETHDAKNGQEAVHPHHDGACFDLILMDLDMLVMTPLDI
ncbi:hypothetical protein H5410_015736 [Solanum commersonii]|uniref:Response regulatory domain-containing protein n=1 Tax=Solanum commersonii TaxID=4109 RepID=A0A9J5ZUN4_SOLCO|nr:hypothetical protein H5410_015736 [Solanum commersonii]